MHLVFILLLGLFLRLYKLDSIPAEMWGDIVEAYKYTKSIFLGDWPLYFVAGIGPLYFYLITPIIKVVGLSFYSLKLASSLVGMGVIVVTYLFARDLFNKRVGLMAAFLVAVSKWPIAYSRWGNANILVPLFTGLIFWLLVKYWRKPNIILIPVMGVLCGLGMYIYPGFWFVPPVASSFLFSIDWRKSKSLMLSLKNSFIFGAIMLFTMLPFFYKTLPQLAPTSGESYVGSKLFIVDGRVNPNLVSQLLINTKNSLGMFHVRGDSIFRGNPSGQPHIDQISGILMIVGIIWLLYKRKIAPMLFLLIPFFLIQIPSILVVNFPSEIPSATRTVGLFPFLFTIVALGVEPMWKLFSKKRLMFVIIMTTIAVSIVYINYQNYFVLYANGLPDHNTPFSKIIAKRINEIDQNVPVFMLGCCWGSYAQPEPNAVNFIMLEKHPFVSLGYKDEADREACNLARDKRPKIIIIDPSWADTLKRITDCAKNYQIEDVVKKDYNVGKLVIIR